MLRLGHWSAVEYLQHAPRPAPGLPLVCCRLHTTSQGQPPEVSAPRPLHTRARRCGRRPYMRRPSSGCQTIQNYNTNDARQCEARRCKKISPQRERTQQTFTRIQSKQTHLRISSSSHVMFLMSSSGSCNQAERHKTFLQQRTSIKCVQRNSVGKDWLRPKSNKFSRTSWC
jgi:hypothetical protein